MFFYLSKLVWLFSEPANAILFALLLALGLAMGTRYASAARWIGAAATLTLVIVAFAPVGAMALRPLEDRFLPPDADMPAPTGIVVLGGSTDEVISDARHQVTVTGAATRITAAVELSRRFPTARLVFSGGSGALLLRPRTEAEDTRALWIAMGVPPERIMVEDRSRNTYENALFTRQLIAPKAGERWLLVTSASHMPRSVGVFRHVGFPVTAFPVDYKTTGTSLDLLPNRRAVEGWDRFDLAAREWVGLLIYRLTGKSDALFPAPDVVP